MLVMRKPADNAVQLGMQRPSNAAGAFPLADNVVIDDGDDSLRDSACGSRSARSSSPGDRAAASSTIRALAGRRPGR